MGSAGGGEGSVRAPGLLSRGHAGSAWGGRHRGAAGLGRPRPGGTRVSPGGPRPTPTSLLHGHVTCGLSEVLLRPGRPAEPRRALPAGRRPVRSSHRVHPPTPRPQFLQTTESPSVRGRIRGLGAERGLGERGQAGQRLAGQQRHLVARRLCAPRGAGAQPWELVSRAGGWPQWNRGRRRWGGWGGRRRFFRYHTQRVSPTRHNTGAIRDLLGVSRGRC